MSTIQGAVFIAVERTTSFLYSKWWRRPLGSAQSCSVPS